MMTNLEHIDAMRAIDCDDMLSHIDALADQFENAWNHAQALPLPNDYGDVRQIVVCGMGGSAIGGDLTAALVSATSPVPFTVLRGYDLPAYVSGPETLVIASSNSGNTEETLAAAHQAIERGAKLLAVTTGGTLTAHATAHGYPLWQFSYQSPPRAALGWSFGLLIGLAARLQLAPNLEADLQEALAVMRQYQPLYAIDTPVAQNPAKRGAGQLIGRIPVVHGSGIFEPVARRWKGQFNENAKTWAQFEAMPEANHNAVTGIINPEDRIPNMAALFIDSPEFDHPRVSLRYTFTGQIYLQNGIKVDTFHPQGNSALAQMCHAIQYGDYTSFYLALAYEADPTEIAPIIELKTRLADEG
ncbi:MAG: bifunctional phosphoglucose/phosphomannose isomerase [Anaerolineae bacterium]|nr:bifunctional phosphoglucose/phosphomannose isomerase [Anaerolineae bacterium]